MTSFAAPKKRARKPRIRGNACPVCGGEATRPAVDNFGRPYLGCAICTIVVIPPAGGQR
jgi:formate dehydrogenase maturation protein FdhE